MDSPRFRNRHDGCLCVLLLYEEKYKCLAITAWYFGVWLLSPYWSIGFVDGDLKLRFPPRMENEIDENTCQQPAQGVSKAGGHT